MATEAQKIRQAYRDGIRYGAAAAAEETLQQVVVLLADMPEAVKRLQQFDPSTVEVKT